MCAFYYCMLRKIKWNRSFLSWDKDVEITVPSMPECRHEQTGSRLLGTAETPPVTAYYPLLGSHINSFLECTLF